MGPERILPNSEEDVAQDRPLDTAVPEEWSGEDMEEEEDNAGDEDSAGYYYQPLNQDPDGMNNSHTEPADEATAAEQLQEVQDRIEVQERSLGCLLHPHISGQVWFYPLIAWFHYI